MAIAGVVIEDLVLEVCHAPGAGALVLGGAMAGYRRFADAVSEGAHFPYSIVGVTHDDEWETGTGTLDGEGRLVRSPVASSAGGAAVDFSSGEKHIGLTPGADWLNAVNDHGHDVVGIEGLAEALAGKQAASGELSAIAALATTAFGRGALCQADAAACRGYIGAGTVTSVAGSGGTTGLTIDGGPVSAGGTLTLGGTLALAHGGTGASDAAGARAALGLGSAATHAAIDFLSTAGGTISGNMSLNPAASGSGGGIQIECVANSLAQMTLTSYRTHATSVHAAIVGNAAYGTLASPSPVGAANANMMEISARPYRASSSGFVQSARLTFYSTAAHSDSNLGVYLGIDLTPDGSTTRAQVARFDAGVGLTVTGTVRPDADNSRSLGEAARRWSVVYAGTGTINTSDGQAKCGVGAVDDALLDAWGQVEWRQYRFIEAVDRKGDAARWHVGLVAQAVRDAIDTALGEGAAVRLGLLCFDAWEAQAAVVDDDGRHVQSARPAGNRWGLRYDECLALEAAWQRRRMDRIETRIAALEASNAAG